MKRFLPLLLTLLFCSICAVYAQVQVISIPTGVSTQALMTETNGSIAATASTITFNAASTNIDIITSSGAALLYVNLVGGTASTSGGTSMIVYPNIPYKYVGQPSISSISIIGASASGTYSIVAH